MFKKVLFITLVLFVLVFSQMTEKCLADVPNQLAQAEADVEDKHYEKAEGTYKNIIAANPNNIYTQDAQRGLALLYLFADKIEQAEAIYRQNLVLFSPETSTPKAVMQMAEICWLLDKYDRALKLYEYVLGNWPDGKDAIWAQTGIVLVNITRGDDSGAQAAIDKLFADFSEHKEISTATLEIAKSDRYGEAKRLKQYVIDNWPDSEYAMWSLVSVAISEINLGNDPSAEAAIEKLLTEFSDHNNIAQAIYDIADTYNNAQQYEKARRLFEQGIENWPDSDWVDLSGVALQPQEELVRSYIGLAEKSITQGSYDEALFYAHVIAQSYPDFEFSWYGLFTIGNLNERMKASGLVGNEVDITITSAYRRLVQDYPNCRKAKYAAFRLAESAFAKENWDDVIFYNEFLLTKFESGEEPLVILYPLALAYDNVGRYEDALEAYKLFTVRANTNDPRRDSVLQRIAELEVIINGQVSMIPLSDTLLSKVFGGCKKCYTWWPPAYFCDTGGPLSCGWAGCIEGPAGGYYCKDQYCECNVEGKHCISWVGGGPCTSETRSCAEGSCRSFACYCTEGMTCRSNIEETLNNCIGTFPYCR